MDSLEPLEEIVREANRDYHDRIDTEEYEDNKSIFGPGRQRRIRNYMQQLSEAGDTLLDVGCGTGNILRIAREYFERCYGVDLSRNMLCAARRHGPTGMGFAQSGASQLPFPDQSFDVVSFYAILHHFPNPGKFLVEGERVLRSGGYLYTDHDPNYYLMRFYHPLYRLMHLYRSGFGDETADMAEFYHTQEPGIDPEELADRLESLGFREVNVEYYQTFNDDLSVEKKTALRVLRPLSKILGFRSFFTHFSILARK